MASLLPEHLGQLKIPKLCTSAISPVSLLTHTFKFDDHFLPRENNHRVYIIYTMIARVLRGTSDDLFLPEAVVLESRFIFSTLVF